MALQGSTNGFGWWFGFLGFCYETSYYLQEINGWLQKDAAYRKNIQLQKQIGFGMFEQKPSGIQTFID